jgi:hypothetical protein
MIHDHEAAVNGIIRGKTEELEEKPSQYHTFHDKSDMD